MSRLDELMKLFYTARPRRRHRQAAAIISITRLDGTGTMADSGLAEVSTAPPSLPGRAGNAAETGKLGHDFRAGDSEVKVGARV